MFVDKTESICVLCGYDVLYGRHEPCVHTGSNAHLFCFHIITICSSDVDEKDIKSGRHILIMSRSDYVAVEQLQQENKLFRLICV